MTHKIHNLLRSYYAGKIDRNTFIKEYFDNNFFDQNSIISIIEKGLYSKDSEIIEEAIALISTNLYDIHIYKNYLMELLLSPWHTKHEVIVSLLNKISSPDIVDVLYDATTLQFDYLDYDDTFQLARKCIKAIAAVNDDNSLSKLEILSQNKNEKIRDYAKHELKKIKPNN